MASVGISHGTAVLRFPDGKREERTLSEDYTAGDAVNDFMSRFHVDGDYSEYCGLYGYTAFNAVRYFENIPVRDTRPTSGRG